MRQTIESFRERTSRAVLALGGMIRRLVVGKADAKGFWQLFGYEDAEGNVETFPSVEAFQHVGFKSRPKKGAEVILVQIGGESGNPITIASRDRSIEFDLAEDETAVFNGVSRVHLKADGTIELVAKAGQEVKITDGSGTPKFLVTKDAYEVHTHPDPSSGSTGVPNNGGSASSYTSVLRGK